MRLHIHLKDGTPISLNWLDSDYSSLWEFSSYQPLCGWLLMMCLVSTLFYQTDCYEETANGRCKERRHE
jgi:hypothetical protein